MEHVSTTNQQRLSLVEGLKPKQDISQTKTAEQVHQQLPYILQTSLILEDMLGLFQREVDAVFPECSFHYQNSSMKVQIDSAQKFHHRCHYKLEMNGDYLGDITFTQRKKFSDADIHFLEDLLSLLVHPLKNCLLYKKALAAALLDDLTNLGNRAAYEKNLQREVERTKRHDTPLSLIVIDIDNFKSINDQFGHSSGDKALKILADMINHSLRSSDMAFRFGGEEFVLLLPETNIHDAEIVAERVRESVSQILSHDGKNSFSFTVSLGVAQLQTNEEGYHLFERADMALYEAKHTGKNVTVCARQP
ncbi:MAG: GGDEF domain-containing protein [Methylophaga sp.]|uniref:GGDEF domain-containing protein n=1 Tax=Methylophaga sp. UBA678 TaxID=1946901 RepID=UPI000C3C1FB3|nr:GGDEF domain-containing protein [Methylophaga sp. UBA678]MAX53560.1 GGDEF domain-containing protein [Methylophaga sp.]|tara:strand:+ start:5722 stop:6639 length:918 start_codon:yes stop_codon:yes gene_type:complete